MMSSLFCCRTWGRLVAVAALVGAGCVPTNNLNNNGWGGQDAALDRTDDDGDGYSEAQGDCDDRNPNVHPGVTEVVDGIDNNCDGKVDDDLDGDGWGVLDGDCDDNDPYVHPLAGEDCNDGVDNNCNNFVDGQEPDKDGDGFGPCDQPYADCNDNEFLIGPASIEDPSDGVDNDCDGFIDNAEPDCDCQASEPGETMTQRMLKALGLCNQAVVLSATPNGNSLGYGAFTDWGSVLPRTQANSPSVEGLPTNNCQFVILSTGTARAADPQDDTYSSDLGIYNTSDPAPSSGQDGAEINDLTQFQIRLKVPPNVTGFSFDFVFFSAEYPEFVCTEFNDTFYALVEGDPGLNGGQRTNISFDQNSNEITVNNGFFEYQIPPWTFNIAGTGYEAADSLAAWTMFAVSGCTLPSYAAPKYRGSMSGWLRTTSPLTAGEEVDLIFSIHDEGDEILDSAVIIDNFRWQTVPIDGPGTVK